MSSILHAFVIVEAAAAMFWLPLQYENVPVYKQKFEPKIIKEEFLNQKPHFIDIPVPYEKPVYV